MNSEDFQIYYSDTVHNHLDLGPIQIFGYNSDDSCIQYRTIGTETGHDCHDSIDNFRSKLSQPKLNHYAYNKTVMWPFQKGDRFFKKGLHLERVYDVALTGRLAKSFPSTYDKIRDIVMQRECRSLRSISKRVSSEGMVCICNDKLDHVCILNESDMDNRKQEFYFGPRKIEGSGLHCMVKFFSGRPHDLVLKVDGAIPSILDRYHRLLKDKIIHTLRSKTLNPRGEEILLNLVSGFYDQSIISCMTGSLRADIIDYFEPKEPDVTTKCFYKSIWLMDIGGKENEDLEGIGFFTDMIATINRGYS